MSAPDTVPDDPTAHTPDAEASAAQARGLVPLLARITEVGTAAQASIPGLYALGLPFLRHRRSNGQSVGADLRRVAGTHARPHPVQGRGATELRH